MQKNLLSTIATISIYFIFNIIYLSTFVKTDVVVLVDLWNFTSPCGCLANGLCCGSSLDSNCVQGCRVRTKICLDQINSNGNINDFNSCPFGSSTINPIDNSNTFSYNTNDSEANSDTPDIFTFLWNNNGPPQFKIKIYTDDLRTSSSQINASRIIDYYVIDFNNDLSYIPTTGSAPNNWIEYPLVPGMVSRTNSSLRSFISFKVAVKCTTNYYTSSCNVRCVPQDNCGGHYTCNEVTGEKICNYGFYDPSTSCVKKNSSINLCDTDNYCENNGTCYKAYFIQINDYYPLCCCPSGFGGSTCNEILSCDVNPCQNNGLCAINSTSGYGYCQCQLGYKGKFCETKIVCPTNYYGDDCSVYCVAINACEIHTKCDYFGQLNCIDGWGNFPFCNKRLINPNIDPECPPVTASCLNGGSCWNKQCCCPQGFTGSRCEVIIDPCSNSPCLNNGLCISNSTTYVCRCLSGYTGIFCQTPIDPCIDRTLCSGNGLCVPNATYTGYTCQCNNGYTGSNCNTTINNCLSTPCQNDGTCYPFINGYVCNCPKGFSGVNCEIQINLCSTRPCGTNGNCISIPGDYLCTCNQGWSNPKTCNDDIDECASTPSPCLNGTCVNLPGSFMCNCFPGFTGMYCEKFIDACTSNPCSNALACNNLINSFVCVCLPGYSGLTCSVDINECQSQPCSNNGICKDLVNGYECNCTTGFEGSRCERQIDLCAQRPCISGQFVQCLPYLNDYICICNAGYEGKRCEININECLSNPCKNSGTCIDDVNGYRCICPQGYAATDCSINLDPCANTTSNPCGSNGVCYPRFDVVTTYFCLCNPGYQGRNCEITVSQCNTLKPCLNNGICTDFINNFTCTCLPGYTGRYCEVDILECESSPCINGICLDGINSFTCLCYPTFTGITCDKRIDVCASNPCLNNGTCTINLQDPGKFICTCTSFYTGPFCQTLVNPCDQNPCVTGQGFCEALTINGSYTFQCRCVSGYEGNLCETITDNCKNNPCKNGQCQNLLGSYRCNCSPNYYGVNCENFYLCSQSPCDSVGAYSCTDDLNKFACNCKPGYNGTFCEININDCENTPCLNNGTCTDIVNGYICTCPRYYYGKQCEIKYNFCNPNPCYGNAACINLPESFQCECPMEYSGILCNQLKDACSSVPCTNGGSCINLVTDFACNCVPGYTSKNCSEQINECLSNPCINNATCIDSLNGFYCSCQPGFAGTTCANIIDNCATNNVCLNGGTCVNKINGYTCLCPTGFTGSRCDSTFDLCATSNFLCYNNGLCLSASNGTLYCTCPKGFEGLQCENNIDECLSSPCQNNATCVDLVAGYFCICVTDFYGTNCQSKSDNCASSPCRNNGTCTDKIGSFECQCQNGYFGNICQSATNFCTQNTCVYGTCVNQVNGFTCNCYPGFNGQSCENDINECLVGVNGDAACLNNATCINSPGSYYCSCPPGYTGTRCETIFNRCLPSPCIRGTCINYNTTFECRCPDGFSGPFCEFDVDECVSNLTSCFNNATCVNTLGSYQCVCLNGYTGPKCELSIDFCTQNICNNGGICQNIPGSFICRCLPGFTGTTCQIDINECASLPCLNGGTCSAPSNAPNFYQCTCPNGITGINCELLVNPCDQSPCINNSTCIDASTFGNTNSYICYCPPGYTGSKCETRISICNIKTQCQNGGLCTETSPTTFTCTCSANYTGSLCEIKIDSCFNNSCLNGATCVAQDSNYICICTNLYTGVYCERNKTFCNPNPCFNSGVCTEPIPGNFTCSCPTGTFGVYCENIIQVCSSNPCNFGQCIQNSINSYTCICFPGYTGRNCEIDVDECKPDPCKNNATCITPYVNMYQCICPYGFEGYNCDTYTDFCKNNPCYFNSTCIQTKPIEFSCSCSPGYVGDRCLIEINECASGPCKNGGNCIDKINGYTCQCIPGTVGVNCEFIIDQCSTQPCQNNATCQTYINFYQCQCPPGFTGRNCEFTTDFCSLLVPCRNNATCVNQPNLNSYVCNCVPGYTGQYCENIIDRCSQQPNPCLNNGTCRLTGINAFSCQCPPNWGGQTCEQSFNLCSSSPCLNGGTCFNSGASYQCFCPSNWQGTRCEIAIDLCNPNPCVNNGNCTQITSPTLNYQCKCPGGYTGANCELDIDECLIPNICYANSFCINLPGTYKCNCLSGYTGATCNIKILNCVSSPCNTGTCEETNNGYKCTCPCGYTGPRCELEINDCTPNPCLNGGLCTEPTKCGYQCLCISPYKGTNCSEIQTTTITTQGTTPSNQFIINYPQSIVDYGAVDKVNFVSYLPCIYQAWSVANPPACPAGFANVRSSIQGDIGNCYAIFKNLVNQDTATQSCASFNSKLLSISSIEEYSLLKTWLSTQSITSDLWTSGTYINNDWYWDNNTIISTQLRNASNLQRNNNENAVSLNSRAFELTSALSSSTKAFICKRTPTLLQPGSLLIGYKNADSGLYFQQNQDAKPVIKIYFDVNITKINAENYGVVRPPTSTEYNIYCRSIQDNTVFYKNYWSIDICGDFSNANTNKQDLDAISSALTQAWTTKLSDISNCKCINVDVFEPTKYVGPNGEDVTRIPYIVYANTLNLIFEKGVTTYKEPTVTELTSTFQNKYNLCVANTLASQLFTAIFCGIIKKTDYTSLRNNIITAWSPYADSSAKIDVTIQGQQEYVSPGDGSVSTMIRYSISINNVLIDQSTQTSYSYQGILINLSNIKPLCQDSYPYSYQFRLITKEKLCASRIPYVQNLLKSYYTDFKSIQSIRASIQIPRNAIEEYYDLSGNVYYSIPIYVILDNGLLDPRLNTDVYDLFKDRIGRIDYLNEKYFTLVNTNALQLYRSPLAFKIYTNGLVQKSLISRMQDYIKEAFQSTNSATTNINVRIIRQEEMITLKGDTINQCLVFISNQDVYYYDGRIENTDPLISYLISKFNTLTDTLRLSTGEALQILNQINSQLVRQSDLFTFYLQNNLMAISPNDLLGLSTVANRAWNQFYNQQNTSGSSIVLVIYNYEKYVDRNNLYLGINYMVSNQNQMLTKECFDMTTFPFNSLACSSCPICGIQSYKYFLASNEVTNNYYYIDLIGKINFNETNTIDWLTTGIYKAWVDEYKEYSNSSLISKPVIAVPFETRIGSYGVFITRIYYIIYLQGIMAINGFDRSPKLENIERFIQQSNADLKVYYPNYNSIERAWFGTAYINKYPLISNDKTSLEDLINARQKQLLNRTVSSTEILASEPYFDTINSNLVTRVYYRFLAPDTLKEPCSLQNLYLTQFNNTYVVSQTPFGYFVFVRSLDLKRSQNIIDVDLLASAIQSIWLNKNNVNSTLRESDVKVQLIDQEPYTSLTDGPIRRVDYIVTINDRDIAETYYKEPLIADFNNYLNKFVNVCSCYPLTSYRTYFRGINFDPNTISKILQSSWSAINKNINVTINLNPTPVVFNDRGTTNSQITRFNYTVLINNIAEPDTLFTNEPSDQYLLNAFKQANISYCDVTCVPMFLYDVYLYNNVSADKYTALQAGLVDAWYSQNKETFNKNLGVVNIVRVDQCCTSKAGDQLYRLYYTFGLSDVSTARIAAPINNDADVSDILDPTDDNYNKTIGNIVRVYPRQNGIVQNTPTSSSSQVEVVTELKWWMILIIVIAGILLALLIALAIFAFLYVKRNSRKHNLRTPIQQGFREPLESQRDDIATFRTNNISNTSITDRRPVGTISTIKSQTRSFKTDIDNDDENMRAMKLNLPQQYEVTIN